jgi:subtilisin-like proprotein convertase family protein
VSDDVPKPFPPYGVLQSLLSVTRVGVISDVNVVRLDIVASFRAFDLYLRSPSGARMHLLSWQCANQATRITIGIDDEAASGLPPCQRQQQITGTYRSYRTPLSTVDGTQAAGTWTLEIDLGPGLGPVVPDQQSGQLRSWGVQVCYRPEGPIGQGPPPATMPPWVWTASCIIMESSCTPAPGEREPLCSAAYGAAAETGYAAHHRKAFYESYVSLAPTRRAPAPHR